MHFAQEDPIGRRIQLTVDLAAGSSPADMRPPAWFTIVGIAPTVRQRNMQERDPDPVAYFPLKTDPRVAVALLVRGEGDPSALTPVVREAVRAIDPDLPLFGIQTMNERLATQRWPYQVFGSMFAIFSRACWCRRVRQIQSRSCRSSPCWRWRRSPRACGRPIVQRGWIR